MSPHSRAVFDLFYTIEIVLAPFALWAIWSVARWSYRKGWWR